MADGRWVMTEAELNSVACGFQDKKITELPNYGKHLQVDNRAGKAPQVCAFCGGENLQSGFGGYGDGFGYLSSRCNDCGGNTDFVYKDEHGKYFK